MEETHGRCSGQACSAGPSAKVDLMVALASVQSPCIPQIGSFCLWLLIDSVLRRLRESTALRTRVKPGHSYCREPQAQQFYFILVMETSLMEPSAGSVGTP